MIGARPGWPIKVRPFRFGMVSEWFRKPETADFRAIGRVGTIRMPFPSPAHARAHVRARAMRKTHKRFRPFQFIPVQKISNKYQVLIKMMAWVSSFRVASGVGMEGVGGARIAIRKGEAAGRPEVADRVRARAAADAHLSRVGWAGEAHAAKGVGCLGSFPGPLAIRGPKAWFVRVSLNSSTLVVVLSVWVRRAGRAIKGMHRG